MISSTYMTEAGSVLMSFSSHIFIPHPTDPCYLFARPPVGSESGRIATLYSPCYVPISDDIMPHIEFAVFNSFADELPWPIPWKLELTTTVDCGESLNESSWRGLYGGQSRIWYGFNSGFPHIDSSPFRVGYAIHAFACMYKNVLKSY